MDEHGRKLTWRERSDKAAFEHDAVLREHPLFKTLVESGALPWIDLTADPTSMDEQQIPVSELLRTMLPKTRVGDFMADQLDVSNNHYAGMSNALRFKAGVQLYGMLKIMNGGAEPSTQDIKYAMASIEVFGGRADLTSELAQNFVKFGKHSLWSSRLTLANTQFFTHMAYVGMNPKYSAKVRTIMAAEYLRYAAFYAGMTAAVRLIGKMMAGDEPDEQQHQFTSGHPAFLQFMRGQMRVDITGGAASLLRGYINTFGGMFGGVARTLLSESVNEALGVSKRVSTESGLPTGERPVFDEGAAWRLIRSKLAPFPQMLANVLTTTTFRGQAVGPFAQPHTPGYSSRYLNILEPVTPVPLSIESLVELIKGDPTQGIAPVREPLALVNAMLWETLGALNNSVPVNHALAERVASGERKAIRDATELEKLKREQRSILRDKEKSPSFKELKSNRIQRKIDRLRR